MILKKGIKMLQTYRKANRNTWFNIDQQIKNNQEETETVSNKRASLLKKPDFDKNKKIANPTKEYVLEIRNAVKKVKL